MSCRSVNSFDFARKNARAFRYECSFSSAKSNELIDQHDMICFNHASAFYKSKNIVKILMNNKFKALILTGNMPDIYVAMFTITSSGFGQSAHSIESRCVVMRIKGTPIFSAIRGPLVIELLEIYGSLDVQWPTLSHGHSSVRKTSEHSTLDDLFPDNVIQWIFAALLALCVGIHRSPVNSPHKGSIIRTLMMVLWCWSHKMTGQHLRLFSNNSYKLIKLFNSVACVANRNLILSENIFHKCRLAVYIDYVCCLFGMLIFFVLKDQFHIVHTLFEYVCLRSTIPVACYYVVYSLDPFLFTWIDFDPSMDK